MIAEAKEARNVAEGGAASVSLGSNPFYLFDKQSRQRLR